MSIVVCTHCGAKNRVQPTSSGTPRCAKCKTMLPWLVDADTARASWCGKPGPPGSPATTSSSPTRERIATPFHVASPWAATS